MTERKWTKGPWKWGQDYYSSDLYPLWEMGMCQAQGYIDWRVEGEEGANKNLIAAAPDLYEALENLLRVHEGEGGTKYHAGEIARKALAKARGEKP